MSSIYIAIGANLGQPQETLLALPQKLSAIDIEVLAMSSLWRNPAWPEGRGYPDYLNAMIQVDFNGDEFTLLERLKSLEVAAGRVAGERNAPRPLDLDIVDFNGHIIAKDQLSLPHPRLHHRAFVLLPLAEIASNWRHPISGLDIMSLLARLPLSEMDKMRLNYRPL